MSNHETEILAEDLKAIIVNQAAFLEEKGLSEEFREWCERLPGSTQE